MEHTHTHRGERIAEALRIELEELINYEMKDPRVGTVAVTEVLISPDKKKAHVRISVSGSTAEQEESVEAIRNARTYLRHQVAERLDLFRAPELSFIADIGTDLRGKAGNLLKKIRKGRPRD